MRTVETVGDWVSEFSLRLYEKQTSNGRFLPPMSSKIIALPHQFKGQLLYEKNSSCGALLIADEVGVGKTYSVGHILRSAVVSDMAKRILILCPARLVKKNGCQR